MARVEHFERIRWKDRSEREREPSPYLPWRGIDTETCRGTVRLICDSEDQHLWDPKTWELLDYLYDPTTRGAFFNLRYDIECILKGIPRESLELLLSEGMCQAFGYVMKYIPKKIFSLKPGTLWGSRKAKARHHYDMAHFFNSSLDKAAKLYLNDSKAGLTKPEVRQLGQHRWAWAKYPAKQIEDYCYHDANLTQRLAVLWDKMAGELELDFSHPISPAYISGLYAQAQGWPYYSEETHKTVGHAAWLAYAGGRFESRVKGYGSYHGADITSAYPGMMEQLPDPDTSWIRLKEQSRLGDLESEYWGFVKAGVKVSPRLEWGPLPVHQRVGPIIYPVGNLGSRWMTLKEYQTFREDPAINLSFEECYLAYDDGARPLRWIGRVFHDRQKLRRTCQDCSQVQEYAITQSRPCRDCGSKSCDPREYVLKVIMNAIYGKTMQKTPKEYLWRTPTESDDLVKLSLRGLVRRDESGLPEIRDVRRWDMGGLFNPIWGATITAWTRLKLWEAVKRFDIAAVATDGILSREPIPASFGSREKRLGTWEVDKEPKNGVIVGNGLYQMEGEKPKRRGFGEPMAGFEWLTALRDAKHRCDICEKVKCGLHITVNDERPLHPGEIMKSRHYTQNDIGLFVPVKRVIDLNADEKRQFPKVTSKDLLSRQVIGKPIRM